MFRYVIHNVAQVTMNYNLNKSQEQGKTKSGAFATIKRLLSLMGAEKKNLYIAIFFILVNAALNLLGPYIMGHTVDNYIVTKHYDGVIKFSIILLVIYLFALLSSYTQTMLMGSVGQRMLFNLRNAIFNKLQELPVDFFYQNKAGDLISRVNNDTDKINQFFSQSLVQFMGSIFTMIGAGVFLLTINVPLGLAALAPALLLLIFTRTISPWVKSRNANNMKSTGSLSAEIQESLQNFKVIIAFNRRDYFRQRFEEANVENYNSAVKAGIANNTFTPVYGLSSNIGQMVVLVFGIYLISTGSFTIGLLISFLAYVAHFYNPLRQIAALWANFQVALAGWDRISQILSFDTDLNIIESKEKVENSSLLSFRNVSFSYSNGKEVLNDISFDLERGKTYAL